MGVCVSGINCCPDWILSLAVIGGAIIYALIGVLIFFLIKSVKDDLEMECILLFIFLWPLIIAGAIAYGVVYYIVRLIAMPIIGADKYDLKDLEGKMERKITREDNKILDYLKYDYKPPKRKAVKSKAKKKAKK